MTGSELAGYPSRLDDDGLGMLNQRPQSYHPDQRDAQSNSSFQFGHGKGQKLGLDKQQSGDRRYNASEARNKIGDTRNKPRVATAGPMKGNHIQKVYGNMVDLVGFEEQNQIADQRYKTQTGHTPVDNFPDRKKRGQSGRPGGRAPVGGLETIYLNKMQKGSQMNATGGFQIAKR